jgi:hypothetical protein
VPSAWVVVRGGDGVPCEAPVEDGVSVVRGFAPGVPLRVEVTDARDARGRRLPLASARVESPAGAPSVAVVLGPGLSIAGRVVSTDGEPISGARIAAVPAAALDAALEGPFDAATTTGADGEFVVGGLEPGAHLLLTVPPPGWAAPDPVETSAPSEGVTLRVRKSSSVRLRVVDPEGRPVPHASVRFRSASRRPGAAVSVESALDGTAVLGAEPTERGTLTVTGAAGYFVAKDWAPHDETVRLGFVFAETATDVVPHPSAPLATGRNAVWCATSQQAWDAVAERLSRARPGSTRALLLGPPAPKDLVDRMNASPFPKDAVDPGASVVEAGLATDGVASRIAAAWRRVFGADAPVPRLDLGPDDVAACAGLSKDLPFRHPFHVHSDPMAFAGGPAILRAWGMRSYETGPGARLAAEQLMVWAPPLRRRGERPEATVVELLPADPEERVVLARLEPRATLEETWAAVEEHQRAWTADTVDPGSLLVVPTVRLDADASFANLEGVPIEGLPGGRLRSFRQALRFRLSERGAEVRAASDVVLSLGIHPDLVFDAPFLVALRRVDRPPYLLLWVGNDALLERAVAPEPAPADAATIEGMVGGWILDSAATERASILDGYRSIEGSLEELGFPPGATPTDDEILARHRERLGNASDGVSWDSRATVHESGRVVVEWGTLVEGMRPDLRYEGWIEVYEGRTVFRLQEGEDVGRIPARMNEGRLELRMLAGGHVVSLRRR